MQQLVGLSAQMINNFKRLQQDMYSNVSIPDGDNCMWIHTFVNL